MAELGFGAQCIKIFLILFNLLVSLAGIGLVVIGSWFLADHGVLHYLGIASADNATVAVLQASAITVIIVGLISLLIGLIGCWGAFRQKTHCLNCYAAVIVLIIILQITGAILAGVFHSKLTNGLLDAMNHTVQHDYGIKRIETDAWDFMQYEMSCCGAAGPADWKTSAWKHNHTDKPVPITCCVLKNHNLTDPQPVDVDKCYMDAAKQSIPKSNYLHTSGCESSLESWIGKHLAILVTLAVVVVFIEVAVVILSCVLRARINRGYEYV